MEDKETKQAKRYTMTGRVVSDRSDKTIVVQVERRKPHPLYGKVVKTLTKFKVHDENNEARTGDNVLIEQTRPLSKEKRWRLLSVTRRAQLPE